MRKFTLFLSLVVAFITATAQEVTVTSLDQLSNDKTYFIESQRCFLMNNTTANAGGISTSTATNLGTSSVSKDWADANQQFKIEQIDGNYYLYSVGAAKYVAKDGSWSETAVDALEITPAASNTYNWKLCIGGNGMNSQIPGQIASGIMVNSWTQEDEGNCYKILDTEASVLVVVDYPNELSEFDQNKCYTVSTTTRGGWAVQMDTEGNYTKFCSTKDAGLGTESNPEDASQQFAVLSVDNENYYLYSVAAKKFVNSDQSLVAGIAEPIELADASTMGDCRVRVNFKGYDNKYINLGGSSQMLVDNWGTIDGGNAVAFIEAADFDPTEALAMLNSTPEVPALPTYKVYTLDASYNPSPLEGALSSVQNFVLTFDGAALALAENASAGIFDPVAGGYVAEAQLVVDDQMFGQPILGVMFAEPFATSGNYNLHIPAGSFTVNGQAYEEIMAEFTIEASTPVVPESKPLAIESITPAEGEVDEINSIIITFNQQINLAYKPDYSGVISAEIYLTNGNGDKIKMVDATDTSVGLNQVKYTCGDMINWEVVENPVTAAGTYTLDASQIVVDYDYVNYEYNAQGYCEGTYSWTIAEKAVVEEPVAVDGETYTFTAVWGTTELYIYNNNGTLAVATRGEEELPESAMFVCEYNADAEYKYQFKTLDGAYYLAYPTLGGRNWLDGESETGLEAESSRVTMFNINPYETSDGIEGLYTLNGYRGYDNGKLVDMFGPIVVKHSAMTFDGASDPYYNENFTSAIRIEKVEKSVEPEVPAVPVEITSVDQITNAKCYTIVSSDTGRGGFYALDGKVDMCGVTYKAGSDACHQVALNNEDPAQQFAFVNYEGKLYLYSVSQKKFVVKSGNVNKLSAEAPYDFVIVNKEDNGKFSLSINGTNYMTASPGWCSNAERNTCIQTTLTSKSENDGWDAGAWYTITEVADFDATEAIAMLTPELAALEVVSYTPAEAVESLQEITVTFSDEIAGEQDLMSMNVIYVDKKQNAANFVVEGNTLKITLWTAITEAGEHALYVPEGLITRKADGSAIAINGEIVFNVVEPLAALEVVEYTPAEAVESLQEITVTFSDEIAGEQDLMSMSTIYVGKKQNAANFVVEGNTLKITLWTAITEAGEYGLYIPEGLITRKADGSAIAMSGEITFVVEEPIVDGIEGVDAEAENAVIYDLTGRRIAEITKAGIYIVNGKKVFVK